MDLKIHDSKKELSKYFTEIVLKDLVKECEKRIKEKEKKKRDKKNNLLFKKIFPGYSSSANF